MKRTMLLSKIYRAVVTDANKEYEGSIEIDKELLEAAGMLKYEQVQVYNVTNGNRFETYIIEGKPGSGTIGVKGAAARLVAVGDILIIATYAVMELSEAENAKPTVVYVDGNNKRINK